MSDLSVRTAPKRSSGQSSRQAEKPRNRNAWGTVRKLGKIRQAEKIYELRKALLALGYELGAASTAQSLGLGRSTLWAILDSKHRHTGLSTKTIRRMLSAEGTPKGVRKVLEQYLRKRLAGLYGHNQREIALYRLNVG